MARTIEQPTVVQEPGAGEKTMTHLRHPAFAQISASRAYGKITLYGSDFTHDRSITVRIKRSEMHRHLSRDWHHGTDEIIEIAMSEAQWATFISSMNVGDGVPCTILHENGELTPALPPPDSRTEQFRAEFVGRLEAVLKSIDDLAENVGSMGLPKGKVNALRSHLETIKNGIRSSVPFTVEQFGRHVEETVEKAKQEVMGYVGMTLSRTKLGDQAADVPLMIEDVKKAPESGA